MADMTAQGANLNGLGIWYLFLSISWTLAVVGGGLFLWTKRAMPLVKVRGIYLSFTAIAFLHAYWVPVQVVYVIVPWFPQQAEYWIMGIFLPFGLGLFHIANSQFLLVAEGQKKFAQRDCHSDGLNTCFLGRFRMKRRTARMLRIFGGAMVVQFLAVLITWLLSRKYHPSFGIAGTEVSGSPWDINTAQGKGWEWWASVVWQLWWTWVVAPTTLYKSRRVHDTLGWRFQTLGCCVAGLCAVPMWLIAMYVPAMESVNTYWIPPQWIALSIMLIEIFTIFVPCWQVMKQGHLREDTLREITVWTHNKNSPTSLSTGSTKVSRASTWKILSSTFEKALPARESTETSRSGESLLSMGALEHVLENNPHPLREYSSLKDFSGENVAFLVAVSEWKSAFPNDATDDQIRRHFTDALRIYSDFVSPRDADFPINLSSQDLHKLESSFEEAARALFGDQALVDPVTPFEKFKSLPPPVASRLSQDSERPMIAPSRSNEAAPVEMRPMTIAARVNYLGPIPEGFDSAVFDSATNHIKYLVLTNTWPKFIKDTKRVSEISEETGSLKEGMSFANRLSRFLACEV